MQLKKTKTKHNQKKPQNPQTITSPPKKKKNTYTKTKPTLPLLPIFPYFDIQAQFSTSR